MKNSLEFIPGDKKYAKEAAVLIYESSHELLGFMFKNKKNALKALEKLYKKNRGHFSYKFSTLAMENGELIGLELGYSKDMLRKEELIGSIYLLLNSPVSIWWHLIAKVGPVVDNYVPKPKEGHYYVNNVAVSSKKRSAGLGGAILQESVKRAQQQGFKGIEGDVTKVNTRAIKFYEAHGLIKTTESNNQEEYEKLGLPPLIRVVREF